jgi:hypothetical protein
MSAVPVHCNVCRGIFLPPASHPAAAAQCPHCTAQLLVGECAQAVQPAGASGQEYIRVTEDEEARRRADVQHRKWMRRTVLLTAGAAAGGALLYLLRKPERDDAARAQQEKINALEASRRLSDQETADLTALAGRWLAAAQWEQLLPDAAAADVVRPAMEWHYGPGGHVLEPDRLVALGDIHRSRDGMEPSRLQITTARAASRWLPLLKEHGSWKVDWEAYSAADVHRWASFLTEPAGTEIEVRLHAALKPGAEPWLIKVNASPTREVAVHLWSYERTALAAAVLPKEAPEWKSLPDIGYNEAIKIIARIKMLDPSAGPPHVRLVEIRQTGWARQPR